MTEDVDNVPGDEPEGAEAVKPDSEAPATEEDTDGDDTAAEDADEGEEEAERPKAKPKGGFQRRISQLTADKRQAERDAAYWREMALRGNQPQQQSPTEKQPPRQEDYQDYTAYIADVSKWNAEQAAKEYIANEKANISRQRSEAAKQQQKAAYDAKLAKAYEKYEDFDDVAFSDRVHISDHMVDAIMDSEIGPDIQYHLGMHPEEAQRIARLSPVRQIAEIGKLEAKLSAPPPPKRTSQAPPPIKPVAGRGANAGGKNPDDLPIDEWMKLERSGKLKYR